MSIDEDNLTKRGASSGVCQSPLFNEMNPIIDFKNPPGSQHKKGRVLNNGNPCSNPLFSHQLWCAGPEVVNPGISGIFVAALNCEEGKFFLKLSYHDHRFLNSK